jgi:cytochrome b subunit of formate dehydrogenase
MESTHGKLVSRSETDAPVCTSCHGEHGIISPDDPRSPVSPTKIAEQTCSPCHESAVLNEKYGLRAGRLTTFIDSYHGLKSMAGDTEVANCASCHGVHRILPSTDPTSTIYPSNLQETCGECHPGISERLANNPVHGVGEEGLHTELAELIATLYIIAIIVVISLMILNCLLDLIRQMKIMMRKRPTVRRMYPQEIWQHAFLMVAFTVLVISGFALQYSESWFVKFFFGWKGGFELRGLIHRIAAVVFMMTTIWHILYAVISKRGKKFLKDMLPAKLDFVHFWQRLLFNLGRREEGPRFNRFSYMEKAEYWALIWGTIIMVITGMMLWFDNFFLQHLPKGALDIALMIHFYEAWLATLAILVWHMYFTVFNPQVYPMNPSWFTGLMPEEMYEHEHPENIDEARQEEKEWIEKKIKKISTTDIALDTKKDNNKEPGE